MMTLVEYFVRHYTLVIDNTQDTYYSATRAAESVIRDSDVTASEWTAMSVKDRNERWAAEIGEKIMDLISGWYEESVSDRDHPGSLLTREIMILSHSDIGRYLGEHYMPEDSDITHLLSTDDEDDEDDEDEG